MPKRQPKRVRRELTPEENRRRNRALEETDARKAEILAKGRLIKSAHRQADAAVRDALDRLKAERQAQGLSLSDVEEKTGIGRSALSRLENETDLNPTVVTLTRYAEALGKKIVVRFE